MGEKIKRITIPAAFGAGFADGLILGIGVKTGIEPSHEGIGMLILDVLCKNPSTGSVSFCSYLWFLGLVFFIIGIATFFEDVQTNGILYLFGLIIGFFLMMSN